MCIFVLSLYNMLEQLHCYRYRQIALASVAGAKISKFLQNCFQLCVRFSLVSLFICVHKIQIYNHKRERPEDFVASLRVYYTRLVYILLRQINFNQLNCHIKNMIMINCLS